MLTHLTLRDFAVVSAAEVALEPRLTVVSGETGAGKSLLVDALLCLTGTRADAGMVRHGAERAELSAEFALDDCAAARAWLAENELDDTSSNGSGGCQLRRVIRADGGSRAWINGRPATLAQLEELGAMLVEIHGQHEHQALLERAHQLDLLDAYGQHSATLVELRKQARRWSEAGRALAELARGGEVAERIAYLQHQHEELAREQLDGDSIEALLGGHRRHANAAALSAAYASALARLGGDDGRPLTRSLGQLHSELSRHVDSEPRLAEVGELLESARIQADEAASLLERLADELDTDPAQLQEMEARLTRLHELARKHRLPLPELAARRDALGEELDSLRGAGERAQALAAERDAALAAWRESAQALTKARGAAAEKLSAAVGAVLGELGMAGSIFAVELPPQEGDTPSPSGAERCEFLVSANPGQPPRPLRKVASGGELARISLAIEVAALGLDAVPTMVFDEVDSGIGGAVAEVVGQKLRALGAERQVLCVTHLPQVAAQGHQHLQVSKAIAGGGAASAVARLDDKARIEELARMLGGVEITRETRANAKQMLQKAQSAP
jgi:DNA repair protein RecN (Recombination protein N)